MASQLNKNLQNLRKYSGRLSTESAIDYQEKMAGAATPSKADPLGMAPSFSLSKEKNINKARARVAVLIKAASSKKGTVKKLEASEKQRKESLSRLMGTHTVTRKRRVYDESKTENKKKDKKRKFHYVYHEKEVPYEFTTEEYLALIETFNRMKNLPGYDSEQVLEAFAHEHIDSSFRSVSELQDFIEEKGTKGDLIYQLDEISDKRKQKLRAKYIKNRNGEWVLTE